MSALLETPHGDLESDGAATDHKLVASVRRGDERAFEALYQRYHRRIHAYAFGMVKDHQRAEDVTQEVFVSALRRMRATERPIAFKPWVYEIAKNACIDQFRRSKRAEEVSYNADDGLAPSDYGRLVSPEPVPEKALDCKQQLEQLCGAFGGLSDAHHEILVLRELEGLSYREIGDRMGMSRPAVESTLFRARRRLTEEYDELASGQRCLRIQSIISGAGSGRLGARDTRRLARHVAHCQPCRRQALAAGVVDPAAVQRRPLRDRAIEKVAGLFPIPLFLRGRRDGSGDSWLGQLPMFSDHAAAGGAKLAAVAALVVAGLGAGVGTQIGSADDDSANQARPAKAAETRRAEQSSGAPAATSPAVIPSRPAAAGRERNAARVRAVKRQTAGSERASRQPAKSHGGQSPASSQDPSSGSAGGADVSAPEQVRRPLEESTAGTGGTGTPSAEVPQISVPTNDSVTQTVDPIAAVGGTIEQVGEPVQQVQQGVQETVPKVTEPVKGALGILGG
jgi:RNA polymerase sigma factor (sigma-70 family)